jgi:tripartite-type tricarboxylate transporter receptor subunit TctC
MTPMRTLCILLAIVIAPAQLAAQSYPSKPVRFVVPVAPGGSTDTTARIIAEAMSSILGQPFVVENRPGAATTIGIDFVAKSKPDGYTVGISGVAAIAIIPNVDPKLSYNPDRDLDVISGLASVDGIIVARPDLKQNTMAEVLEASRTNPGSISFSTSGIAGPAHLEMEQLQRLSGTKMLHVPFSGDVPAITAVLSGDVSIAVVSTTAAMPFVLDGRLKALAANGPGTSRMKVMPDLASVSEQTGFSQYSPQMWSVLVAAKDTPPDVVDILNKAVNASLARPDVVERFAKLGLRPLSGDARKIQEFVRTDAAEKKRIIDAIGLKRE